jgi:hypothetical protein
MAFATELPEAGGRRAEMLRHALHQTWIRKPIGAMVRAVGRSSIILRRLSQPFTLCPALPDATGPENDPISAARMTSGCSAPS